MILELDDLRARFGRFLIWLFWAHVPLLAAVAMMTGRSPLAAACAGAAMAGAYHISWMRVGIAPATRYLSAVVLMGEPALLLYLMSGHVWQMDMHMYFFAMLALTVAWCDRRTILFGAIVVAIHHLVLNYLLPMAVFPGNGDLGRVMLHAAIVAFQAAVLIWFGNMLIESFKRINAMRDEIMVKNDVLQERTLEAEAANKAKSMFLANMSHEIRTPMNAILGFCHLALRTNMDSRQKDYVSKISNASTSLLRLINDILDFSKNEAGKLSLEQRPFNLRSSLQSQLNLAAIEAENKGIKIDAVIGENVPEILLGDELRLNQVVLNLVGNAVKFSEKGSVIVAVELLEQDADDITLEISVTDNGLGMSAEQQALLFSSFTQADNSMTRRFGGTGLGLAISKQIIEQMNGTISVKSKPGAGSTFTVTVNMAVGELQPQTTKLLPAKLSQLRILVADDNSASREIFHGIFASWGIGIDLVASGEEVLGALESASLANKPYELVLLDWKMPGMDGLQTARAIHANETLSLLPFMILVTAYGKDSCHEEAERSGITAFLSKPVEPDVLFDTITDLFSDDTEQSGLAAEVALDIPRVAQHLRGSKVLLAEDSAINREIAIELLQDAGLVVDIAENGRIACDMLRDNPLRYVGVLMDVQMPEMDGIEATLHIRKSWSSEALPIIAMTAHAYEEERQKCFKAGMNDHIAKPVDPFLLVRTLDRWLKPRNSNLAKNSTREAIAPKVSTSELPDSLPPFNINKALSRVNGKRALLRKLIIDFSKNFSETVPQLRQQIEGGSVEDARRLTHTLKGVAASLELAELTAVAEKAEAALTHGEISDLNGLLTELEQALKPAVRAAQSLYIEEVPHQQLEAKIVLSPTAVADIEAFRSLLERRSMKARSQFEAFAASIGMTNVMMQSHPIKTALDTLDYGRALALLDEEFAGASKRAAVSLPTGE